jgi:hypothetical protein
LHCFADRTDNRGGHEKVNVIRHENVCVNRATVARRRDCEVTPKPLEIRWLSEHGRAIVAALDDVLRLSEQRAA